jgi:hypothetical protein
MPAFFRVLGGSALENHLTYRNRRKATPTKGRKVRTDANVNRDGLIYLTETKSGKARQILINERAAQVFRELRHKDPFNPPMCSVPRMISGSMK